MAFAYNILKYNIIIIIIIIHLLVRSLQWFWYFSKFANHANLQVS